MEEQVAARTRLQHLMMFNIYKAWSTRDCSLKTAYMKDLHYDIGESLYQHAKEKEDIEKSADRKRSANIRKLMKSCFTGKIIEKSRKHNKQETAWGKSKATEN